MKTIDKDLFIKVCNEELTMAKAAARLNLHFNTFKKYALKFECYSPNQSGKGIKKNIQKRILNLEEYSSRASIRKIIIKENLIEHKCSECYIQTWNNKPLSVLSLRPGELLGLDLII
jgi:deoxyadenosine/deoxycytidine kinase